MILKKGKSIKVLKCGGSFLKKMRVIIVYDINQKRVSKVMKICREYLHHVQNSVFEGDITTANFNQIKDRLLGVIDEVDSVLIYTFRTAMYKKEVLGFEKNEISNII
jgi:CRISPR-associated protein Cas2